MSQSETIPSWPEARRAAHGIGTSEREIAEFQLSVAATDAVRAAAAKRGITPAELGRRIIEAAARDELIGAVLDDGVGA